MRKFFGTFLLVLIPALIAANTSNLTPQLIAPALLATGNETSTAPVVYPPYDYLPGDGTDLVGDTVTIGTTWYETRFTRSKKF